MTKGRETRDRLLDAGRRLFWSRGYSNVSVREIAQTAEADVALISRYFGSKQKLFEATLDLVPGIEICAPAGPDTLVDALVELFVAAPRAAGLPSPLSLILLNVRDPEVGEIVRAAYRRKWQAPMDRIVDDPGKGALLSAVLLGVSLAEKSLELPGIAAPGSACYEAQLRRMFAAALADGPEPVSRA